MTMLRRNLLQGFYYYLLLSLTIIVFLCFSVFNNLSVGNIFKSLIAPAFDEDNSVMSTLCVRLLIYHLLALLAIIIFKRQQVKLGGALFALLAVFFFIVFIVPSVFFLLGFFINATGVH